MLILTHYLESRNSPFYYNTIIRLYTRLNFPIYAFHVYLSMLKQGVLPDHYTLPIIIKALGLNYSLNITQQLHNVAIFLKVEDDEFVESALINGYAKRGDFVNAHKVFDENPERKLGSWNAILAGFSQSGSSRDAVDVFLRMRRSGLEPDGVTMVCVTSACGGLGDIRLALQLHRCVFELKCKRKEDVLKMMNSVIDMYGKCGRMDMANSVFNDMNNRNVSSWTSMIMGYASHGHANEAMEVFHAMIEAGVKPNDVTFIGVLGACVHCGMVDEMKRCFQMMNSYGIQPRKQHYGCMFDLLGRAGFLEEARIMVEEIPMKPNVVMWGCLLKASEKYNDVKMAEWAAKHFLELEPWNDGVYVVLSNIYASREMWEEVEKIRQIMKQRKLAKLQGYSSK